MLSPSPPRDAKNGENPEDAYADEKRAIERTIKTAFVENEKSYVFILLLSFADSSRDILSLTLSLALTRETPFLFISEKHS